MSFVFSRRRLETLAPDEFRSALVARVDAGGRLVAFFGLPSGDGSRLHAVVADDARGSVQVSVAEVRGLFPSITPVCPQAQLFERELHETGSINIAGHPWLKPVRRPLAYNDFFKVEGHEIHEVGVGPVHAGIIEPGHFRFQCHGEKVLHLEIALGYQHRGIEAMLCGASPARAACIAELVAGDTSAAHTVAVCEALEALSGEAVKGDAAICRAIALELERLANHTGDLGALANDIGFLPVASFCGRLRGDFLNMTALVCGNRFGRGWIVPGGTAFGIDAALAEELRDRLQKHARDVRGAAELLFATPSVQSRFEGIGKITQEDCRALGATGVAARATGIARDARLDFPSPGYAGSGLRASVSQYGDVHARAVVRWREIQQSFGFLERALGVLQPGGQDADRMNLAPDSIAVSFVEGWRGPVCHVVLTDSKGRIEHCKIVDPSFYNWMALAIAMRGQQISDFPLCNKSFNLSYSGFDL
ncbi:MAG: hypothetical protein A2583_04355 [Bdellovibrionales bacterium RIFOXYD1_FULL_53_11]|nr:MAG: hypothetical protein A2583_04355 [Bdellovibrionales bacterium RIFOXYD1_FULL_53_11]